MFLVDFKCVNWNIEHFKVFKKLYPKITDELYLVETREQGVIIVKDLPNHLAFDSEDSAIVFKQWWKQYRKLFGKDDPMDTPFPNGDLTRFTAMVDYTKSKEESDHAEIMIWLMQRCKGKVAVHRSTGNGRLIFCFQKHSDAVMFKLTYG